MTKDQVEQMYPPPDMSTVNPMQETKKHDIPCDCNEGECGNGRDGPCQNTSQKDTASSRPVDAAPSNHSNPPVTFEDPPPHTPISNLSRKQISKSISKVLPYLKEITKRYQKAQGASSASCVRTKKIRKETSLDDLPFDIVFLMLDHLDPIDRTVLRYVCKSFYSSIPSVSNYPTLGRTCGKTRLLTRLFDSSIFPQIKKGDHILTRPEIKALLRSESQCILCDNFWPYERQVHCPFHRPLGVSQNPITPPKLTRLNQLFNFNYLVEVFKTFTMLTPDKYRRLMAREAIRTDLSDSNFFCVPFALTWSETLHKNEVEIKDNEDPELPELPPPIRTWGRRAWRITQEPQTFTLKCCNHCMNVLPDNSHLNQCHHCDCVWCGWSNVELLRVFTPLYWYPLYVPLGCVVGVNKEAAKEKKTRRTSLQKLEKGMTRNGRRIEGQLRATRMRCTPGYNGATASISCLLDVIF